MTNLSLVQRVILFLKKYPEKAFTAREIACGLIQLYPDYYQQKRKNSQQSFTSEQEFISQIVSEIGASKNRLNRPKTGIYIQDQPRPRVYQWKDDVQGAISSINSFNDEEDMDDDQDSMLALKKEDYNEFDLYPLLIKYLVKEHQLWCDRINEKCSKNDKGKNANKWLHPDIVALQPVTEEWNSLIKTCVQAGGGQMAYLWSFEVKKEITRSTVRQSFFQAVSNSSWANYGYLVCASIADDGSMNELRMLSALHGIGVMVLKVDNITESEIIIPALFKSEIDWCSVNRLVDENRDMELFVQKVASYYKSGLLQQKGWSGKE